MRDPARIPEVLEKVRLVWEKYPDLRLGQLLCVLAGKDDPFYMEEDRLMRRATEVYVRGWHSCAICGCPSPDHSPDCEVPKLRGIDWVAPENVPTEGPTSPDSIGKAK